MFSREFCGISENTLFYRTPLVAASDFTFLRVNFLFLKSLLLIFWIFKFSSLFKGTAMQIEKLLINDRLRISKVSWKFHILSIYNFAVIYPQNELFC